MRCHVPIPAAFFTLLPTQSIFFILVNIRIYSLRSQGASSPPLSHPCFSFSQPNYFLPRLLYIFLLILQNVFVILWIWRQYSFAGNFHGFSPTSEFSSLSFYMVLSRTLNLDMKVVVSSFLFSQFSNFTFPCSRRFCFPLLRYSYLRYPPIWFIFLFEISSYLRYPPIWFIFLFEISSY